MKEIRLAQEKDIPKIENLLEQILLVHHKGRPDIFKATGKKYTTKELTEMLNDSSKPIFVATNENDNVIGYIFCIFKQQINRISHCKSKPSFCYQFIVIQSISK